MIQKLFSNWLNWRCYDTVFNSPENESEKWTSTFCLLSVHFCWTNCIKSPFTFLLCQSIHVRACVRCQSQRRLLFHLYSQSEIRGRSTAYTLSSPTLLSVSAELISEEGHLFTQQTKREWHTASELQHFFFFFWSRNFFFFNSHNRPAFIWALTSDACFKNTQGTVL